MKEELVALVSATEKAMCLIDRFTLEAQRGQVPNVTLGAFKDIHEIRKSLEAAQRLTGGKGR